MDLRMADLSHLAHILIVEDDGLIALDIETTLQAAGAARVTSLATAEDALRSLEETSFDAAVLDLHLGRGGFSYEVAGRLKEKGVPFVLSSGTAEVSDAFRDVPMVMKPFSSDELVTALAGVTAGHIAGAAETARPAPAATITSPSVARGGGSGT